MQSILKLIMQHVIVMDKRCTKTGLEPEIITQLSISHIHSERCRSALEKRIT